MEEHQITMDGKTIKLPSPFMVLATQNHIETYGTYHLPEAQMDRFLMKVSMGYPTKDEEIMILDVQNRKISSVEAVMSTEDIVALQAQVEAVKVSLAVKKYIIDITNCTRRSTNFSLGVSPRGSIALYKVAKAMAFIDGRDYVTPDDVKSIANVVLAHRIVLSPNGRAEYANEYIAIDDILRNVKVTVVNEI
jgi:MoxR-like ATPase